LIKTFKAQFCVCYNQQLKGIDFFETYAPVDHSMLDAHSCEIPIGLKSKQGNVTAAFLHAKLPEGEKLYVDMPRGFEQFSKQ